MSLIEYIIDIQDSTNERLSESTNKEEIMEGLIDLGWFDETLLEALCKVAGRQGGTVHQYFGNQDWWPMYEAYRDLRKCGITFESKASLNKLAKQYHLTIHW